MAEPSWKVMQEKQEVEFHAQEENQGGAGLLCHLPVLTTFLGLAGQQDDPSALPLAYSLCWLPQACILSALCFPGFWLGSPV